MFCANCSRNKRNFSRRNPGRAEKLITVGDHKRDAALNPIDLAATTALAQAIMNALMPLFGNADIL